MILCFEMTNHTMEKVKRKFDLTCKLETTKWSFHFNVGFRRDFARCDV